MTRELATPRPPNRGASSLASSARSAGGLIGLLFGMAIPLGKRQLTDAFRIQLSWISVAVAFAVSFLVGVIFGLLPANRAARLDPTDALRYE